MKNCSHNFWNLLKGKSQLFDFAEPLAALIIVLICTSTGLWKFDSAG